jgi:hypothetical protein
MMPLLGVVIHPFQLPAGWNLTRPNNFTLSNNYSKAEYTNTKQDVTDKSYPKTCSAFGWWICFAKKQLGSWILTFNILAQIQVRLPLLP